MGVIRIIITQQNVNVIIFDNVTTTIKSESGKWEVTGRVTIQ